MNHLRMLALIETNRAVQRACEAEMDRLPKGDRLARALSYAAAVADQTADELEEMTTGPVYRVIRWLVARADDRGRAKAFDAAMTADVRRLIGLEETS